MANMRHGVDPNAPTEENEPIRVPARTVSRTVVVVVAAGVFVLALLAVALMAGGMALFRR